MSTPSPLSITQSRHREWGELQLSLGVSTSRLPDPRASVSSAAERELGASAVTALKQDGGARGPSELFSGNLCY